ncbi:class I adenylate-forming enzyme family protein [Streptomyces sp. NBC_00525]|uniref:class I adenylate-forming enzyme family protein n=1 Tax=Streptomyces sp. NBC_00525 TaxID=2903660 RepID=UPI002E808921|nr:class I adenylate-forming enzyme family protein [Streptomyces sp. NBC_00525]WUC94848.1 acyl--CoA ligase [Streptomyces sp. NBC_00525]
MTWTASPRMRDAETALHGDALLRRVAGASRALRGRGVRSGDRVLVRGDNSLDYVVTLLALVHLDTSLVPVDHRTSPADVSAMAARCDARWLVGDGTRPDRIPAERVLAPQVLAAAQAEDASAAADIDLEPWFRRRDALVLSSSGTTGRPKGIVKSGPAVRDNTLRTIEAMGYRPDDVLAPLLPFSHQYGLSVVLVWWLARCTLLITPYQRLDLAVGQAAAGGATAVDAAPSTYHTLLQVVRRRPDVRAGLAGVRIWGVGGAPLPRPLADTFRETMGRPLLDGYGLTELGNVALATPEFPVGCGRALPGVGLRVVRPDGTLARPGEPGEIEVRSPGLMECYLAADGALDPVVDTGWYPTADLGHLDAEGNLHVHGRNRAVHRLGFTLYPESLERKAELCGRPVKVVAAQDVRRGASLHFVVADPDGGEPRDWRRRLAPHLADYEQPNSVHVIREFPLGTNGKVDTAALGALIGVG